MLKKKKKNSYSGVQTHGATLDDGVQAEPSPHILRSLLSPQRHFAPFEPVFVAAHGMTLPSVVAQTGIGFTLQHAPVSDALLLSQASPEHLFVDLSLS